MPAIAVGPLLDEQIVPYQQRRLHRARRDAEGLESEGSGDQSDEDRVDDGTHEFHRAAGAVFRHDPLGSGGHWMGSRAAMKPAGRRPVNPPQRRSQDAAPSGTAEMMTMAWAWGNSSVMVRSICAFMPSGTMDCSRCAAPPVSTSVGLPVGRFTTPMSRQNTPWFMPVPSALEQASLAAKRLA